jgi:hypothetical protein
VVEPIPPSRAVRLAPPDDAQEASYLAASARISSFCSKDLGIPHLLMFTFCSFYGKAHSAAIPAFVDHSSAWDPAFFARGLVC